MEAVSRRVPCLLTLFVLRRMPGRTSQRRTVLARLELLGGEFSALGTLLRRNEDFQIRSLGAEPGAKPPQRADVGKMVVPTQPKETPVGEIRFGTREDLGIGKVVMEHDQFDLHEQNRLDRRPAFAPAEQRLQRLPQL